MRKNRFFLLLTCILLIIVGSCCKPSSKRPAPQIFRDLIVISKGDVVLYLANKQYRIEQQFRGPGVYNVLLLQERKNNQYVNIDSLDAYWHDYIFHPMRMKYDQKQAWIEYNSEGSGTGLYGDHRNFVIIHKGKFREVFNYPAYYSCIDVETDPFQIVDFTATMHKKSKHQLRLKAVYTERLVDRETDKTLQVLQKEKDDVLFQRDPKTGVYHWKSSTNEGLKPFWKGDMVEPIIE